MNEHIKTILNAKRPVDVFGALNGTHEEQLDELKKLFRALARATHTDVNTDPLANDAMARLNVFYGDAKLLIASGDYHKGVGKPTSITVKTRLHQYEIIPTPIFQGDVSVYFDADVLPNSDAMLIKAARNPGDNALIQNEAKVLKTVLNSEDVKEGGYRAFFPQYVEHFGIKTGSVTRQALAMKKMPYAFYTLEDVRNQYPNGVDPKDMAWMMRRLLFVLGLTARAGVVHGAVLPKHILIQPEKHGLVLIDWKYATEGGVGSKKLKAIPAGSKEWYPPEVFDKNKTIGGGTDIWMALQCMAYVMGRHNLNDRMPDSIPKPIRAFFNGCMLESLNIRPNDGFALGMEFDDLLERLYGPRKFRTFTMSPQ